MNEKLEIVAEMRKVLASRLELFNASISKIEQALAVIDAESFRIKNELRKLEHENTLLQQQLRDINLREKEALSQSKGDQN